MRCLKAKLRIQDPVLERAEGWVSLVSEFFFFFMEWDYNLLEQFLPERHREESHTEKGADPW